MKEPGERKVIIVTGGSGLLGDSFIQELTRSGFITVNFDVSVEEDLKKGNVLCDVTDDYSIANSIKKVYNYYGRIDGLVNNAYPRTKDWGIDFEEEDLSSWRKNVDVQMNSYVSFCHKILPYLKEKGGSIVNITSIYGVVANDPSMYVDTGVRPPAAYTAIKGGIINFTKYLAAFYGKYGIRVNCISPGGIFDNQDKAFVDRYERKVPMGRMGAPEDIAPSVSFLLSDGSRYITGQNLIVDGGWTII